MNPPGHSLFPHPGSQGSLIFRPIVREVEGSSLKEPMIRHVKLIGALLLCASGYKKAKSPQQNLCSLQEGNDMEEALGKELGGG